MWFSALDVDNSGTVEEDEIRALMHAMGVEVSSSLETHASVT